jgi:uncharacterized membrane protein YjjP (DUF1212 family)
LSRAEDGVNLEQFEDTLAKTKGMLELGAHSERVHHQSDRVGKQYDSTYFIDD